MIPGPNNGQDGAQDDGQDDGHDGENGFGFKWRDTIAIGQYDFDIHRMACALPDYLGGTNGSYYHPAAKYYILYSALGK